MNHEAHGGSVSRAFLEQLHLPNFIIEICILTANIIIQHSYMNPFGCRWIYYLS